MKARALRFLLLAGLTALSACATRTAVGGAPPSGKQAVELTTVPAMVQMQVPRDWIALAPSPARAEFMGPNHRARVYLRAMTAQSKNKSCDVLAKDYAREVIESWGGPPRTKLAHKTVTEGRVDFELHRSDPKPNGEIILSRVKCEDGALAVASCSGPAWVEAELRPACADILDSVRIIPKTFE